MIAIEFWLSIVRDSWCIVSPSCEIAKGLGLEDCMNWFANKVCDVFVSSHETLELLLSFCQADRRPNDQILRETDGLNMQIAGFFFTKGPKFWDGSMILPEKLRAFCHKLGVKTPQGDAIDHVRQWCIVHSTQQSELETICNLKKASHTLSACAIRSALPYTWRTGGNYFVNKDKDSPYDAIRNAFYGGRAQIFKPGWQGDAVEFDINSAYGAALCGEIPDWQTYQNRSHGPYEPYWLDCTVELSGKVGPIPVRDKESGKLEYPTSGQWRGWWCGLDLERDGVRIVETYREVYGRANNDLRAPVEKWLELRSQTACKARKATIRGLAVGLYGKLAQRPFSWGLWHASEGLPPLGSRQVGTTAWFAYPVKPKRLPLSLPTTASYITASVRATVWPYIGDGQAIYTHTDSVHMPLDYLQSGGVCPELGDRHGQWSIKGEGHGDYRGVNDYSIGAKVVKL